jgi:type VI secretion system protein ImpE
MTAKELFEAGQIAAAVKQLNRDVRSHPTDAHLRTFLFEMLCFAGDYQRAERQLDVLAQQGATAEAGVQVYRNILVAEQARRRLYSEGLMPDFLGDPPAYAYLQLEAINRLREGHPTEAAALVEQSERTWPQLRGQVDGSPFQDFRDGDDLLAPILEVIIQRHYVWIPFEHISHLSIAPPKRLRDLLWIPARVESPHGPVGDVFLPVLYASSAEHADDRVRLGRMTDWKASAEGLALGVGQRLFLIDGQDRAMLQVRDIDFNIPVPPDSAP